MFVIGSIIFFILNLFMIKKALVGVADLQELNKNKVSTWKAFNLVTPSVVRSDFLLILLTICPKFLWHKFGEIGVGLTDYLLIVNSLHSPHLSAWYCIEIVRRNSVLVTHSWEFNPLNPKSDWHLISPLNITPESHINVMRIKEMIINKRNLWSVNKFSLSAP